MKLSIIIPIYNEQDNIVPLYHELKEALAKVPGGSEMIFVNDGSRDGSFAKLRELAA